MSHRIRLRYGTAHTSKFGAVAVFMLLKERGNHKNEETSEGIPFMRSQIKVITNTNKCGYDCTTNSYTVRSLRI